MTSIAVRSGSRISIKETHRCMVILFASLLVTGFGLTISPASAMAGEAFVLSHSFHLPEAKGVAVNQATGDVYVASGEDVYEFTSAGTPISASPALTGATLTDPSGVAVDNSDQPTAGDIYVTERYRFGAVAKFNPEGEFVETVITQESIPPGDRSEGGFGPNGVAVDSEGDIYVADSEGGQIDKFSPDGTFIQQDHTVGVNGVGYVLGDAVDSFGNVYAANYFHGLIELDSSLECVDICTPIGGPRSLQAVAVSDANELYADSGGQVSAFDSSGVELSQFGAGILSGTSDGVAVNSINGFVYVTDPEKESVFIYERATPEVITGAATNVGQSSVSVDGRIDPAGHGEVFGCRFEYGTGSVYGFSVPCAPSGRLSGSTEVSAKLSELLPGTSYIFRVSARNENGISYGDSGQFDTAPAPLIGRVTAVNASENAVDLVASIDPNGLPTTYHFEFGFNVGIWDGVA